MLNESKKVEVEERSYLDYHLCNLESLSQKFVDINYELEILSNKAGYCSDSCQMKAEPTINNEGNFGLKDKIELLFFYISETQKSIETHVESLKRFI
jgi:hypothetical protein